MLQELCQKYDLPLELKLFTDGEQCYEYLLHNDAQLVIMDIFLAQGTGVELVRRLRKQGFGFKLVFLTTSNEFANESYELAASYYLLKPLQSEQLEKALRCCGQRGIYRLGHRRCSCAHQAEGYRGCRGAG